MLPNRPMNGGPGLRLANFESFEPAAFLAGCGLVGNTQIFRAEEIIYSQGDPADCVFLIQRGTVKLTVVSNEGKEAALGLLGSGEFLGETCISGKVSQRMTAAVAITNCAMLRISRTALFDVIRREPLFLDFFLSFILGRNVRMQEELIAHRFNSSEKRLARVLMLLAGLTDSPEDQAQISRISHEALAEMVGTTRSRISFFMNRFRKQGHVAYGSGPRGTVLIRRSLSRVVLDDPRCEQCSATTKSCPIIESCIKVNECA
jgi:CRP/FNR family transcriptional regulator, cyclic AMP receptor protein